MGNCIRASRTAADSSYAYSSKGTSSISTAVQAGSAASSFTVPSSYSEKGSGSVLSAARTEGEILSSPNLKAFLFSDLKAATKNFHTDVLIGEGGFGLVYKGWLAEQTLAPAKPGDGMAVAIKKLKSEGFQGHKEWLTEVNCLGQLHHTNLVKLIGFCSDGNNRLLVYEHMPKGSLENHLFRRTADPLSWAVRIKVAIGAAKGLSFLHDSEIIYRDLKPSNILLDSDFTVKLSDFGLAKAGPTGGRSHISTQAVGTEGYAAPEYIATGRLSASADVYSFGVVLLELLTGRRALDRRKPFSEQNLVEWAVPFICDKKQQRRIMDEKLGGQYPKKAAASVAKLAVQCIDNDPKARPKISSVLEQLQQLQEPQGSISVTEPDRQSYQMPVRS